MAKDVELTFGASNASVGQIRQDLISIIGQVEASGVTKLKFSVDTGSTSAAAKSIQSKTQSIVKSMASSTDQYSKKIVQYYKDLDKQQSSFSKKNLNGIDAEIKQRELASKRYSNLLKAQMQQEQSVQSQKDAFNNKNLNSIDYEIKRREIASKQFSNQLQAQMQQQQKITSEESKSSKSVNQSSIVGVATSFNKVSKSISDMGDAKKNIAGLQNAFENLTVAKLAFDKAPTSANLDAYRAQKITVDSLINGFKTLGKETYSAGNSLMQYQKLLSKIETDYNKYARNIQKNPNLNNQYKDLIGNLKSDIVSGNASREGVLSYRSQFAELDNTLIETGGKVETLAQKFRDLFGIHLSTALTMVGIHALVQGLSQVYQNVVQLDQAVVNLQVATGYSRGQTQELIGMYSQYAKQLGATTVQVADAANDWLNNIGQVKSL